MCSLVSELSLRRLGPAARVVHWTCLHRPSLVEWTPAARTTATEHIKHASTTTTTTSSILMPTTTTTTTVTVAQEGVPPTTTTSTATASHADDPAAFHANPELAASLFPCGNKNEV